MVENVYYVLSKGKAGAERKVGLTEKLPPLIWIKNPYIMQNTKNRETGVKGYWGILDSGAISSLILVLLWHQSLDAFYILPIQFPIFYSICNIYLCYISMGKISNVNLLQWKSDWKYSFSSQWFFCIKFGRISLMMSVGWRWGEWAVLKMFL